MARIAFQGIAKRFGDVSVIEQLDLEIHDHEFMVFVGPSGCGKSTALRMIAGLEEPTEGTLVIGDRVVNDVHPKDRDVAMVFQSYALYPHMTVRENIAFGLRIRKMPEAEIDKLVDEAAGILGLRPLLDRKPKALSGGQRQRVALGRAIVRKPSVFLFDEPLSNLDAELRVQMRAEIAKLQHRLRTTTVYVTHDQVEAMTMADRIVVMHDGIVEQMGEPLELYDRPRNVFVAGFIGSPAMNFVKGSLKADAGKAEFVAEGGLRFPVANLPGTAAGQAVTFGVRPEHLVITPDGIPVEVVVVEPTGSETQVNVRSGQHEFVCLFRDRLLPKPGETIRVSPLPEHVHLFDAETGRRLAA